MNYNKILDTMHSLTQEVANVDELNQNIELLSIYPFSTESGVLCNILNINENDIFNLPHNNLNIQQFQENNNNIIYIKKTIHDDITHSNVELFFVPKEFVINNTNIIQLINTNRLPNFWGIKIYYHSGSWIFWAKDNAVKRYPIRQLIGFSIMFNQYNIFY